MKVVCKVRKLETLSGEASVSNIALPSFWKEVYSKKKEFAPLWSKYFPFIVDIFSFSYYSTGKLSQCAVRRNGQKKEVTEMESQELFENLPSVFGHLNIHESTSILYFKCFVDQYKFRIRCFVMNKCGWRPEFKGECNPNIKYISAWKAEQTIKIDTDLIKIGQEITKLLLLETFNMADIGATILNI